jgi:hypothetical protein
VARARHRRGAGYRRYLHKTATAKGQPAFEIDPGKLAEATRFDGTFVLRTNARLTPLQAVLRYRDLVRVEDLFRRAKAVLRTRPIFHYCDAAICGHVFLLVPGAAAAKASGRSGADRRRNCVFAIARPTGSSAPTARRPWLRYPAAPRSPCRRASSRSRGRRQRRHPNPPQSAAPPEA